MTDEDLLATCLMSEAAGEPDEGKAAVAQVVLNRMARRYQSDGTIAGTVLHPSAFSGFSFDMIDGRYTRVVPLEPQETLRARMVGRAQSMAMHYTRQAVWPECFALAQAAVAGAPLLANPLLTEAVLYANLAISKPPWVHSVSFLAKIGAHSFYSDP